LRAGCSNLLFIANFAALRESVGKPIVTRGGFTMVATAAGGGDARLRLSGQGLRTSKSDRLHVHRTSP
jgi:hypothetical protein